MAHATANCIMRVMAASATAAHEAGNIIRNVFKKGNLNVVEKGYKDYQTEADRLSQRLIYNYLKYYFPSINIIGEEEIVNTPVDGQSCLNCFETLIAKKIIGLECPTDLKTIHEKDLVIWVDPLDGTSEFTEGYLENVTVLIGIAYKSKAIGGIICQPFYDQTVVSKENFLKKYDASKIDWQKISGRIVYGLQGLGVYGINTQKPPENKLIICTTSSHRSQIVQEALDAIKPDKILHVGGCGNKVLLVIEGIAHAYVYASKGTKKWDTCAPEAVLRALGGSLTDLEGNLIDYSPSPPCQSNITVHMADGAQVHSWWVNNYLGIIATNPNVTPSNISSKIPTHVIIKLEEEKKRCIGDTTT